MRDSRWSSRVQNFNMASYFRGLIKYMPKVLRIYMYTTMFLRQKLLLSMNLKIEECNGLCVYIFSCPCFSESSDLRGVSSVLKFQYGVLF